MGDVIRVEFRKERDRERAAFKAFEEAMIKQEKLRRFKTAGIMAGLSLMIILTMTIPFVFDYFTSTN